MLSMNHAEWNTQKVKRNANLTWQNICKFSKVRGQSHFSNHKTTVKVKQWKTKMSLTRFTCGVLNDACFSAQCYRADCLKKSPVIPLAVDQVQADLFMTEDIQRGFLHSGMSREWNVASFSATSCKISGRDRSTCFRGCACNRANACSLLVSNWILTSCQPHWVSSGQSKYLKCWGA